MSCSDITPCSPTPDPCVSPYDNCGCVNPTTFGCVTNSGPALSALGVLNGEDGESILSKINGEIQDLKDDKGKILITDLDTCPAYLLDKFQAGTNVSFTQVGTGCSAKLRIDSTTGGTPPDIYVKVSASDTTTNYLNSKLSGGTYIIKSLLNPSGNESIRFDVVPASLVSTDSGNQLSIGTDGALKTTYSAPDGSETKIVQGSGVIVSGSGTLLDPYVISTNASILAARTCFDGVWRNVTVVSTGNPNVVYVSGQPQYRVRFDGTIEFKGQLTYTVAFGNYQSGNRKYTVTVGSIPTTCVTLPELAGTSDLKSINYIDIPQAAADQIVQQYGYIVRKSAQNIILEFQSAFTNATSKTVVVNFDGCVSHPSL